MICGDPVKDRIIDFLSLSGAAPIKALCAWLQDAWYNLSQAQVYNIVNTLLDAKMLTKKAWKVRLSAWWIESIEEMATRLVQQRDRDGITKIFPWEKRVFEAKSFHELNAIWHDITAQLLTWHQGDVHYYDAHPYHLLGEYTREQKDLMQAKKEKSSLWYVIGWTSFLDLYWRGLAEKSWAKVLCTEKPLFSTGEFWAVVGEYVYKITLDTKVVAYFDMFFQTVVSLDTFRHDLFYDLCSMKWTFTFTLWKDAKLAREIQTDIQAAFTSP